MQLNVRRIVNDASRKLEFFDALIVIYIAAIVREYLWIVHNNLIAWVLTALVSLLLSAMYIALKEPPVERPPKLFWAIVAVPLFLLYLLRAPLPDLSFDVLSYHLLHSERAMRGLLNLPGDFPPAYAPYFGPLPDIITGIFRRVLGYRLGTIVNYLVLLWTASLLFRFLRSFIESVLLRSIAILLIVCSEPLLFEINNYMVDLLALPLLVEATILAVRSPEKSTGKVDKSLIWIFMLLGMSLALKVSNLAFALPIGFAAVYTHLFRGFRGLAVMVRTIAGVVLVFVAPLVPQTVYLYWVTKSPVFPFYNSVFKSPFWGETISHDPRFGPTGIKETVLWPLIIPWHADRLTELGIYSGRISLGIIAAFALLLFARRNQSLIHVSYITILGALLWAASSGNGRYAMFLEVMSGVCLTVLAANLWKTSANQAIVFRTASAIVICALVAQSAVGSSYAIRSEWGGREQIIDVRGAGYQLREFLRDRSLTDYLNSDEARLFDGVGTWVESSYKTGGIAVMIKGDIPYLNLHDRGFFATPAALERFHNAVKLAEGKKMLSIAFAENRELALSRLALSGFSTVSITPIDFPYYSQRRRIPLLVMEVKQDPSTRMNSIFFAEIVPLNVPTEIRAGQSTTVNVKVRNVSGQVWPARGKDGGIGQVNLANKWLDQDERIITGDDARCALPRDLSPGEEVELSISVHAPEKPGEYVLMLDFVQEAVSWFYERGSFPVMLKVHVTR